MTAFVVDTNVPVIANRRAREFYAPRPSQRAETDTEHECHLACVEFLAELVKRNHLVLDDQGEIFSEYAAQGFRHAGEPGVGDMFFKWVFDHQYTRRRCWRVAIRPTPGARLFAEFPDDQALAQFDRSDRKFVSVAIAFHDLRAEQAPIVVAADRGWRRHEAALADNNGLVQFVCREPPAKRQRMRR